MTTITEIAPDVFRISTYLSMANLQFNQFLVKDEEPFLYHTGMRGIFPTVHDAVARILKQKTSVGLASVILRLMSAVRSTNG
jgi:hypothetical protein